MCFPRHQPWKTLRRSVQHHKPPAAGNQPDRQASSTHHGELLKLCCSFKRRAQKCVESIISSLASLESTCDQVCGLAIPPSNSFANFSSSQA